ncbi:MAG: uroporphyrinogen decarboxylase family protein, partial [Nitrososphaeraceae archaeon]
MNSREIFLETMRFNKKVGPNKWEFGIWGATIERWYDEGLNKKNYPKIPTNIINTTTSLYTAIWTRTWQKNRTIFEKIYNQPETEIKLPKGIALMSGGLYWPTQGFPLDKDVKEYFQFDSCQQVVCAEQFIYPNFEIKFLREDEKYIDYIDIDGATRRYSKSQQVLPGGLDWIVKDWNSWNELKEERIRLDNIKERLPGNWDELVKEYKNRDYPLVLGGYPNGLFGSLTHLIGYENLFFFYYDHPDLIKDMLDRLTDVWIALWEEIISKVEIDACNIWEDVSSGKGSMISPAIFIEFLSPYYKKICNFMKSKGVKIIFVDTDGDCNELIPLFLESGVTGLYPMEVSAGMDIVAVRKKYPELQIMGGIPKSEIANGEKRIDEFLEPVEWMLKQGGFIPFGDHFIPPE